MNHSENSLQIIEAAIVKKSNKLALANVLSKKASTDERRGFYSHQAELFKGELSILEEGHARLIKSYLTQLN